MTTIRVATEADAEEILAIYAKYIEQTAITFEYVVPSIEEFRGRIRHTLERFPYLAAEKDGKIAGYAYVSPFKERRHMTGQWRHPFMWIWSRNAAGSAEGFMKSWKIF